MSLSNYIYYKQTEQSTYVGYGEFNDKYLLISTDLDGLPLVKEKLIQMKILDISTYYDVIMSIFKMNEEASIAYITRLKGTDKGDIEEILYLTKLEYELIIEEYKSVLKKKK